MNAKGREKGEGVCKPTGGFCLIRGTALVRAWEAYRKGEIRLMDLRVWFACWEAVARRCRLKKGRGPTYRIEEVQRLVGAKAAKHVRQAITRLERAGLVRWSDSTIAMMEHREEAWTEDFVTLLEQVTNHRRLVPVPRRIIRFLARCPRKVTVATIIGYLLRCLYYKGGLCLPEETCKSSWIAEVFSVNTRNVKAAKKELISMGWVVAIDTRQTHMNRFGGRVRINLEWSDSEPSGNDINPASGRSPLKLKTGTGLPPPNKNIKLSTRSKQPETRNLGPAGFEKLKKKKPTLRNVRPDDLRSSAGLGELFQEAIGMGLLSASDADRLKFFAAAEHAQSVGKMNPCGLFVTVVRRGLWSYVGHADEDRAWAKLKRLREAGELTACDFAGGKSFALSKTIGIKTPVVPVDRERASEDRSAIRAIIRQSFGLVDEPSQHTSAA